MIAMRLAITVRLASFSEVAMLGFAPALQYIRKLWIFHS